MEGYIGQIILFHKNWIPKDWMICDGSEIPVKDYVPLCAVMGYDYTNYETFFLPNLEFDDSDYVYIICVNGNFPQRA